MHFDDFQVGRIFKSPARLVSAEDIQAYAALTGDMNPLHFDDNYAVRVGYKGRIAHGMLVFGLGAGRWYAMDLTKESTVALLGFGKVAFRAPVYPGDGIRLLSEVVSCRPSETRPGSGIVTFKDAVMNQDGEEVLTFERKLMLKTATTK